MHWIIRYLKIFKAHSAAAFDEIVTTKIDVLFLILGKVVRLGLEYTMIYGVFNFVPSLQGYTREEVLMFAITMWVLDTTGQMFLRQFYWVGDRVREHEFDRVLVKPLKTIPLLIAGSIDLFDLATLPIFLFLLVLTIAKLGISSPVALISYGLWLVVGWIVQFAFFLLGGAIGVYTYESHSYLYIYRQLQRLGSYPMEIYPKAAQFFFTFVIPLFVIMMLPTKALIGALDLKVGVAGLVSAVVFVGIVYILWRRAIRTYMTRGG